MRFYLFKGIKALHVPEQPDMKKSGCSGYKKWFWNLRIINISTFGGANSSLFPLQLGRLATMKAEIYKRFAHYQVEHGIYDTFRQFIGLA